MNDDRRASSERLRMPQEGSEPNGERLRDRALKEEQLELFSSRTHALSEAMDRITAANEAIPKSITRATHALMREQLSASKSGRTSPGI